jgi:hypothetical protein
VILLSRAGVVSSLGNPRGPAIEPMLWPPWTGVNPGLGDERLFVPCFVPPFVVTHTSSGSSSVRTISDRDIQNSPVFPFLGGMSRTLRFLPEGGSLVEVTCRTLHARFLLRPSPQWNQIALGVVGRAQRLYGVTIHLFTFASNHYHLLASFRDAGQMAAFMRHVNTNLAKEAGRLVDWKEKLFPRRYQAIPVTAEEGAQIERFRYILAHRCKEGLVERLRDWPGLQCVRALLEDRPLEGLWFHRTQEYAARDGGRSSIPSATPSPRRSRSRRFPAGRSSRPRSAASGSPRW